MQSRIGSALETIWQILIGMLVSYLTWIFIVPLFFPELETDQSTSIAIVLIFTITSFVRSYSIRRISEWYRLLVEKKTIKLHSYLRYDVDPSWIQTYDINRDDLKIGNNIELKNGEVCKIKDIYRRETDAHIKIQL